MPSMMQRSIMTVGLAMWAMAAPGGAESLGEAAKKERERREKNKAAGVTAKRTITQDEVKAGAAPAAPQADAKATPAGTDADKAAAEKSREAAWRARAKAARERIEAASQKLAGIPPTITRVAPYPYTSGYVIEDNPHYKRAEQDVKLAEQAWLALEEDARKQGVLPGWLRD